MRKKKNRIKTKSILIALTIVCISAMLLTMTNIVSFTPLRSAASVLIVPFQKGINSIGSWLNERGASFKNAEELSAENDELKERIAELEAENVKLIQNEAELLRLRKLYDIDQDYSQYEKVAANVISKDPGNWYSTFIIDKGSTSGIEVDMNVISGGGLVGIVTEVGKNWAKIRSIIDDSSNVSAMTITNFDTCIVSGDLTVSDEGYLAFSRMSTENDVLPGERLVTSNISDKYLEGILIGTIASISSDSNDLTKTGYVIPFVDFRNLQEVLVVLETKAGTDE